MSIDRIIEQMKYLDIILKHHREYLNNLAEGRYIGFTNGILLSGLLTQIPALVFGTSSFIVNAHLSTNHSCGIDMTNFQDTIGLKEWLIVNGSIGISLFVLIMFVFVLSCYYRGKQNFLPLKIIISIETILEFFNLAWTFFGSVLFWKYCVDNVPDWIQKYMWALLISTYCFFLASWISKGIWFYFLCESLRHIEETKTREMKSSNNETPNPLSKPTPKPDSFYNTAPDSHCNTVPHSRCNTAPDSHCNTVPHSRCNSAQHSQCNTTAHSLCNSAQHSVCNSVQHSRTNKVPRFIFNTAEDPSCNAAPHIVCDTTVPDHSNTEKTDGFSVNM
jgi:tetrahydromethanopterin S-methyltransferase subunit F